MSALVKALNGNGRLIGHIEVHDRNVEGNYYLFVWEHKPNPRYQARPLARMRVRLYRADGDRMFMLSWKARARLERAGILKPLEVSSEQAPA